MLSIKVFEMRKEVIALKREVAIKLHVYKELKEGQEKDEQVKSLWKLLEEHGYDYTIHDSYVQEL